MENLFELLPLVLIILWTVIGAGGAKKKQEQQRAQQAEAARRAREAQERARLESYEADGSATFPEAQSTSSGSSETSVDMVPDELWKILTGGAPPPTRPRPTETPSYETESVPDGGWSTSPPWDEDDAVHSIEGVSAEEIGAEVLDYDDTAGASARARYENVERTHREEAQGHAAAGIAASEIDDDRRHFEFHDRLLEGEIGGKARVAAPTALARLGLRNRGEVRRAFILTEVLGPPRSLQ